MCKLWNISEASKLRRAGQGSYMDPRRRDDSVLRKGSWSKEEDVLLTKCIEKQGEGKWHQVPLRAGLNRCRKSCRLRWLNYLQPNLKKGEFAMDEVDLIIRMHKLLGNRWTLIAGRLPGRTANDVKNYWYTRLSKKHVIKPDTTGTGRYLSTTSTEDQRKTVLIRPQPLTFSKDSKWITSIHHHCDLEQRSSAEHQMLANKSFSPEFFNGHEATMSTSYSWWWENIPSEKVNSSCYTSTTGLITKEQEQFIRDLCVDDDNFGLEYDICSSIADDLWA